MSSPARTTVMAPPTIPGRAEGTVTAQKVFQGPAPEHRAAHSASRGTFLRAFRQNRKAKGAWQIPITPTIPHQL